MGRDGHEQPEQAAKDSCYSESDAQPHDHFSDDPPALFAELTVASRDA
jgi:hypothetical protein